MPRHAAPPHGMAWHGAAARRPPRGCCGHSRAPLRALLHACGLRIARRLVGIRRLYTAVRPFIYPPYESFLSPLPPVTVQPLALQHTAGATFPALTCHTGLSGVIPSRHCHSATALSHTGHGRAVLARYRTSDTLDVPLSEARTCDFSQGYFILVTGIRKPKRWP